MMRLKLMAMQVQDKFACRSVENLPIVTKHAKVNVACLFPLNDPVSFMNSYPAEKGKNEKQI